MVGRVILLILNIGLAVLSISFGITLLLGGVGSINEYLVAGGVTIIALLNIGGICRFIHKQKNSNK